MKLLYQKTKPAVSWMLAGLLVLLLLPSCTSTLYLKVMQPARINVGEHIKTIALVNRTKPQNTKANVAEAVLTGEGLYQDKSGVENAFAGLNDGLHNSPRFQIKQTNVQLTGSGAGNIFPAPLSWNEVDKLCKQYQADAICTVETFDTDTQIIPSMRVADKTGQDGKVLKLPEFSAAMRAQVKMGIRLYDPRNRTIRDEFHFTHSLGWTGTGITPQQAVAVLLDKTAATNQVSYAMGEMYAARITPTWITVVRSYYRKGGRPEMKHAYRLAYVNNWEDAAAIWEDLVKTSKRKTAGKAAYNRAIAAEVLGRLEEAKMWTDKAYTNYRNKQAREYSYVLIRRIRENQRLEDQMKDAAAN